MLSSYYGIYNYTYDANGIRIKKTAGSTTTHYILDGETILAEYNGTAYKKFFYDESGIAGMIYNGATYYFMKNLQGDVVGVYDSAGTLLGEYVYDAWGNLLNSVTNDVLKANPFRYRGYYYDTETKLYYLNSRYYDPATGRFLNMDNISYLDPKSLGGLNLYAYCLNNPVMYTDSSGHFVSIIIGLVVGVCVGIGTMAYLDYKDDGQIFNGSIKWYQYVGAGLLGAILGAAVGYAIGAFAGMTFSFTMPTMSMVNAGGGALAAVEATTVTVTGAQALSAAGVLGTLILFSRGYRMPDHGEPNSTLQHGASTGQYDENGHLISRKDRRGATHFVRGYGYCLPHTHFYKWGLIDGVWTVVEKFIMPF